MDGSLRGMGNTGYELPIQHELFSEVRLPFTMPRRLTWQLSNLLDRSDDDRQWSLDVFSPAGRHGRGRKLGPHRVKTWFTLSARDCPGTRNLNCLNPFLGGFPIPKTQLFSSLRQIMKLSSQCCHDGLCTRSYCGALIQHSNQT